MRVHAFSHAVLDTKLYMHISIATVGHILYQQSIPLLLSCCSLQFEGPNSYSPRCGVNITVPGAAGTNITKVEYLDSIGLYGYANHLVDYFVARGYVRDFSIRAMPYDWRLAAGIYIYLYKNTLHSIKIY